MFFRKIFGAPGTRTPGTRPATALSRSASSAPRSSLGKRRLRLEPLEDRRMLSITMFVDGDSAAPTPDGLAWATAYADLQSALDQAAILNTDGTTENDVNQIWIAEGTYHPTAELEPGEARSASFSMLDNVSLCGGFVGTETTLEERTLSTEHATILSGDLGVIDDSTDNAYSVVYANDVTGTTIDGLTITKGCANLNLPDYPTRTYGGGLWIYESNVSILNSTITQNESYLTGGGIYAELSDLTVIDSTISENVSASGGGLTSFVSTLTMVGSTVSQNTAPEVGGGLFITGSTVEIHHSAFQGNVAGSYGGGIYSSGMNVSITNSLFSGNVSSSDLGGGFYGGNNPITIANST
ncbi:MAG: hypothetical protein PVH19_12100, partial [Planctomycetia bacterium]